MDAWYDDLPVKAQARLDKILEHFRDSPHTAWGSTYFFPLTGLDGIFEIRFTVNNIQYRPLGCFGPAKNEFTFLIGAKEIGDAFVPNKAPDIAMGRRKEILVDPKKTNECNF